MTERWSLHPEILPDEAVTSWIKRIAQLHLNDIASVLRMRSLRGFMIDKLDIDPPIEMVNHLSSKTGMSKLRIVENILMNYDSNFPHSNSPTTGNIRQGLDDLKYFKFMPFIQNHRIRTLNKTSFRYCPMCLCEEIPYFRWFWRLAYYIICLKHEILLHEICFNCNTPVQFLNEKNNIEICHKCNESYTNAPKIHQSTIIVKRLHDAFINQVSPINELSSQRFLGVFWTIHNTILLREDDYFEKLMKKYSIGIESNIPSTEIAKNSVSYEIVWNIIQKIDGNYEYILPCNECNEYFKTNGSLTGHIKFHQTPSMECDICKELFYENYDLDRHKKSHNNPKHFCRFCNAGFATKRRMGMHFHNSHSEMLKNEIQSSIEKFINSGRKIIFQNISKDTGIPRSIFNNYPEYKDLISVKIDLRARYFQASTLNKEMQNEELKSIILDAIEHLKEKGIHIAQTTVAEEIGVSRQIFTRNDVLRDLVKKHETLKSGIDEEELFNQVKLTIDKMKRQNKDISLKSVSREIGRSASTLSCRSEIKDIINKNRTSSRAKAVNIDYNAVVKIVQHFLQKNEKITKKKIASVIKCHPDRFIKYPKINEYILEQIEAQNEQRSINFENKIRNATDSLILSNQLVSYRSVSRKLNIDVHRILETKRFKEIVEIAVIVQEKGKENTIKNNVKKLISEGKPVTFAELHRQTGFPRSYIESKKIKLLIKSLVQTHIPHLVNQFE